MAPKPQKSQDQMSCREAGQSDHKLKLKTKLTGWGQICHLRKDLPSTRRMRVKANRAQG